MHLVPQTLFGRLVLILLGGVLLAQAASFYINATERGQLLYRAGGLQLAQRIADIARLLDSTAPAERSRIAALFNSPPLAVSLGRPALAPQAGQEEDVPLAIFSGVLRRALGNELRASVVRWQGPPEPEASGLPRPAMSDMPMMRGPGGPGWHRFPQGPRRAFFVVQVALHDGTWVTFDSFLPPQEATLPWRLAFTLAVVVAIVLGVSLVAVRWATAPLSALAAAAERLGQDIHRPPLDESGPLEARRAARAFNTMQSRLVAYLADRTRVFTAMSHDLKTPITRLRLRAEMLQDRSLQGKFTADLDAMQSMVTQTLDFMRDTASEEPVQPVDLMALLESLQSDYQDMGHDVRVEGSVAAALPARPVALRRCLTNLLDNAIRYGGRATIEAGDEPRQVSIRVRDEGPGIPEADLERAFEPFYRGEASRSRETGGSGLGLGIARNIARGHGGDVVLRNRAQGGLEAILILPRP